MARAATGDFLQGFRFHVKAVSKLEDFDPLQNATDRDKENFNPTAGEAGFQSVTLPELSLDPVEYREGNASWTMKQPGIPTVSDMTLMRGVVAKDSVFFDWVVRAIKGNQYRADLEVYHYSRSQMNPEVTPLIEDIRTINCFECFPIRCKPGGDLDSTGSEISMTEVDVAMERFAIDNSKFI